MGCDIHFYSEIKTKHGWESFDFFEINDYYHEELEEHEAEGSDYPKPNKFVPSEIDDDRWYDKFGVLSEGVRREMPWSFEPRGIPIDSCEITKNLYERWGVDAHSTNWVTLKELNDMYIKYRLAYTNGENPLKSLKDKIDDHIQRKLRWRHKINEQDPEHIRFIYWFDN